VVATSAPQPASVAAIISNKNRFMIVLINIVLNQILT
jgi:hypothetical protein